MVVTRSQGEAAEDQEPRRECRRTERRGSDAQAERSELERAARRTQMAPPAASGEDSDPHRYDAERERIELERRRRLELAPPASPTAGYSRSRTAEPNTITSVRHRSPAPSVRTQRSSASVTARLRAAELEAAEKLADLKRKELEMEAELVKKRLAVEVSVIQEEASIQGEEEPQHDRVNEWLRKNPVDAVPREPNILEEPRTPPHDAEARTMERLVEALERVTRPRGRPVDLPTFSGSINEWLPFRAAMKDSTRMYQISAAENLQRLRTCLKGDARDAVAALLHTASDPEQIMKTLEQCFGRPEVIVRTAMEELKKLPRPGHSATDLNKFAIKVQNVVCVLQNMDRREYLYNPLLVQEVLEKLSAHVTSRWCDYAMGNEGDAQPEIVKLSRFLMREADLALRFTHAAPAMASKKEEKPSVPAKTRKNNSGMVYAVADEEQAERCPECGQEHGLPQCPKFRAKTTEQRWERVKEHKLCFKCIRSKHRRMQCKAKPCGVNQCRRPHHAMLHEEPMEKQTEMQGRSTEEAVLSVTATRSAAPRSVLLKMCPVVVVGPRGEVKTHALLDEGATVTLIDEELAHRVGADGPTKPLHLRGVNMAQQDEGSKVVSVRLRGTSGNLHDLRARTVKNLQLHQQRIPEALLNLPHLQELNAEEVCYERAHPCILVGTDHWELIVSRRLKTGRPEQPAASLTQLGWVVHGTVPRSLIQDEEGVFHVHEPAHAKGRDEELHQLVEEHFKIDALGISHQPRVSEADQRAKKIVSSTIKKTDNGYEVGLPWREDQINMPRSYEQALRRLLQIEGKMDASPDFKKEYTAQIQNLLQKGYAEPCDGSEQLSAVCWYLPHFAVQNPNKPGKTRLVFDAAAKSRGCSLNDFLLEGPNLLLSLQGILFRFREKKIAVTADIKEMFLQIKIRKEDQPAQQFLWRGDDRSSPPRRYKMTSVIFGAASSPFIAHFVRDSNAERHAKTHPRALETITRSHYMDDLVASFDDEEETQHVIQEVRAVHRAAGFELRGWNASNPNVLAEVPTELLATAPTNLGSPENKILGLVWDAEQDELGFSTAMNRVPEEVRRQERAPTKREALSAVMSIYDPLGLLSQYTIRAKIILQSLWRLKMPWDDPLPVEEEEQFAAWLQQLSNIKHLRLPRCYALEGHAKIELHVLCDASEQAYATVAYWRVTHRDGTVQVVLVAAKAKVAPRRVQTIPRLELQAAVIGARLADTIKKEHRIEVARTRYWTDSSTVVHWIRHDARRYTPFVAHRLGEIAELSEKEDWRWLPTAENVADDATRLTEDDIRSSDRWFHGPRFLYLPEDQWPADKTIEEDEAEVLHTTEQGNQLEEWTPDPARFSKFEVLVRATANVLAFIDICRRRAKRMEHQHIERAERALLQRAQREDFALEIARLKASRPLPRSSKLYALDPTEEDGLLRVRGRIGAATASAEVKRPVILNGRNHITRLIVQKEHHAAGHANRERVTNDLRQRYWILHLRPTVRAIEHACTWCRIRRSRPRPPAKGDLPRARLEPFHRPFTNCGVDYFGPMTVKIGRRHEKRWGAVFTCLTTRAVHLELVASLSTSSAIMALRRMAARRGWPRLMYSDNGTNFRGADQELRNAYEEWAPALREEGLLHRMEWRFIPPGAPNQGGAWERLVRSVKTALNATMREKVPQEEVLQTLLTEAEHSINARPLTHVSVNADDPEALTPNHFLLGSSTGLPATGACEMADRRTWRATQAMADEFWRRWIREYLPTLVPRGEPSSTRRPLQIGDVVLIVDATLPRNTWPMGIVKRTYPGPDGDVRVAEVQTRTGVFKRPTSRLVVLEATRSCAGGRAVEDENGGR